MDIKKRYSCGEVNGLALAAVDEGARHQPLHSKPGNQILFSDFILPPPALSGAVRNCTIDRHGASQYKKVRLSFDDCTQRGRLKTSGVPA
jgi:hypothetical protein